MYSFLKHRLLYSHIKLFLTALVVLLVGSFHLALFLVWSAANPILRDPAHRPLSTSVSDDKFEAHADVQHLKGVHKLQLAQNVEPILTFSHGIYVYLAH